MRVLHVDHNHPILIKELDSLGFVNHEDYKSDKIAIASRIKDYEGMVIRSRFSVDKDFLDKAINLKFIGRVGAGLENIDTEYADKKGIKLISAPEGNRNAVGEHTLGMLLGLLNKLHTGDREVKNGEWNREHNRGFELDGKTVGIIGYGNMGKAFAKKLRGFETDVVCYDIVAGVGDENARQVSLKEFQQIAEVLSLHTPQTPQTLGMINSNFINAFHKPFWFLNTARGKSVVTSDLVDALQSGKILGAGLDVLEYEKSSFENLFTEKSNKLPAALQYLIEAPNVLLTPHVAGWTIESKMKLAKTIVDKIKETFL